VYIRYCLKGIRLFGSLGTNVAGCNAGLEENAGYGEAEGKQEDETDLQGDHSWTKVV